MDRHELMRVIALATGLSLAAAGVSEAGPKGGGKPDGRDSGSRHEREFESKSKGFEKSQNPKAAGGPNNPGKGNPHNHYRG